MYSVTVEVEIAQLDTVITVLRDGNEVKEGAILAGEVDPVHAVSLRFRMMRAGKLEPYAITDARVT